MYTKIRQFNPGKNRLNKQTHKIAKKNSPKTLYEKFITKGKNEGGHVFRLVNVYINREK